MQLLVSQSTEPGINLATEEFLLKNSTEDIIFLYRNKSCVVVGKHQNTMAEINYRFTEENHIPVIRRISGGGTVYHDEGNLNFTFLQNGEEGNLVNFKAFISPVAAFLKSMNVPAEIGPRNDILINGLKVSGNAEHIFRKRTLHHGTLLFNSTLTDLRNALHTQPGRYTDKAVKSVRSKVTNIKEYLQEELSTDQFFVSFAAFMKNHFNATNFYLPDEAVHEITNSSKTKYADWSWNFGYSPAYSFTNQVNIPPLNFSIQLQVEKGIIHNSVISGQLDETLCKSLINSISGCPHSHSALKGNTEIANLESLANIGSPEILWSFF